MGGWVVATEATEEVVGGWGGFDVLDHHVHEVGHTLWPGVPHTPPAQGTSCMLSRNAVVALVVMG